MKEKITHNMSLKLLSIFIALVVWLVVVNIEDPTISKTIREINVEVINENALSEAGKCYVIDAKDTVDIRVKGPKSVIDKLKVSDFTAVADLSKYSITNSVPVEVEFTSERNFSMEPEIIYGKSTSINIILDDFVTKEFEIASEIQGRVTEGYYVSKEEVKLDSESVKISGPETIINNIGNVSIDVDISDIKEETTMLAKINLVDLYDKEIVSDRITFNRDIVNVTVKPLIEKEVPIKVVTEGKPKKEYSVNNAKCDLTSIKIVGGQDSVDAMQVIELKVDVEGKSKLIKKEFDIMEYISSNVKLSSDDKIAKVEVDFKKIDKRKLTFKASDIEFRNIKTGYLNKFNKDKKISVVLKGLEQYIKNISITEMKPYIDLSNIEKGTHKLKINFENTSNIAISKAVYLEVVIEDSKEVAENAENTDNVQAEEDTDNSNEVEMED